MPRGTPPVYENDTPISQPPQRLPRQFLVAADSFDDNLNDPVVATAILDRLLHHSHVLTVRGDSYRLREKRRSGLIKSTTAPAQVGASA